MVIERSKTLYSSVDGDVELYGKSVSELQTGITINEDSISGILHYVTDCIGFNQTESWRSGNYLALNVDYEPLDVDLGIWLINEEGGSRGGRLNLG